MIKKRKIMIAFNKAIKGDKYMELHAQKLAMAGAKTAGLAYAVCALAVAVAPNFSLKLTGWLIHAQDTSKVLSRQVTATGFIIGLIEVVIYTYLVLWLFGWFYNRSVKA